MRLPKITRTSCDSKVNNMARRRTKCDTNVPQHIIQSVVNECAEMGKKDVDPAKWIESYWDDGVEVVATRTAFEWFAILFKDKEGNLFYADFNGYGTDPDNWRLSNDSGEMESIDEFLNAELTRTFF